MLAQTASAHGTMEDRQASWGAVFALSLGAFALVSSEFMPVSLLTPIAADLGITEGQAGQAISVSGAFAVLTSLFIASVTARLDRRLLLLALIGLTIVSGTIVAIAPNYEIFMLGRALIGVAIGGFWSMSAATAIRLVPPGQVAKALAIFNGGNAMATVVAAPLGSFLGGLIGWRGAFFCVVPVAAVVFIWQWISLPSMQPDRAAGAGGVFALLRRPVVAFGMAGVSLLFMGQFTLFTYVRPFLETVGHVSVPTLSLMLLGMGVSGFIGTSLIGAFLKDRGIYRVLIAIPLIMMVIALALVAFGGGVAMTAALLALWGFFSTAAPVGWWAWLARTLPRDAERGGGLMVAVVQLAITLGAVVGGLLFDSNGYAATFGASALLLLVAALLALLAARQNDPSGGAAS